MIKNEEKDEMKTKKKTSPIDSLVHEWSYLCLLVSRDKKITVKPTFVTECNKYRPLCPVCNEEE